MKIAIFKSVEHGFESVCEESVGILDSYIRVTEYVDADFVRLNSADVTAKEISVLRAAKKKIQAETSVTLDGLDKKIGDLLSLPPAT